MGIGGSTGSRSSPVTVIPKPNTRQLSQETVPAAFQAAQIHYPVTTPQGTESNHPATRCCSHRAANHAHSKSSLPETLPGSSASRKNSIDEEIEEIVANTLDLQSAASSAPRANKLSTSRNLTDHSFPSGSSNESLERHRRSSRMQRSSAFERAETADVVVLPESRDKPQDDIRCNELDDVDFEKFRRVNHKGSAQQKIGRVVHHQDSDLLWRLGLISPEAYTTKNIARSAPVTQGDYLKPPTYDLTEEQLMANIEKEYTEYAGAVN